MATSANTWITIAEAAARVKVHPATLRRACLSGTLRHARLAGRRSIRLKPEWVDEWLTVTTTPVEVR